MQFQNSSGTFGRFKSWLNIQVNVTFKTDKCCFQKPIESAVKLIWILIAQLDHQNKIVNL